MCKYCRDDKNEYLIGDFYDGLSIKDATLIMSSYNDRRYDAVVKKKPINYCPMCGRDLIEAFLDKLKQERQCD